MPFVPIFFVFLSQHSHSLRLIHKGSSRFEVCVVTIEIPISYAYTEHKSERAKNFQVIIAKECE